MGTPLPQQEQLHGALASLADAHKQVTEVGDRLTYPISLSDYREMLEALDLLIAIADGVRVFIGHMQTEERTP